MNEQELRDYVANRKPGYQVRNNNVSGLACFGCAHSASSEAPPGKPSGERPCVTCIRNHEDWRVTEPPDPAQLAIVIDDQGHARCFDASAGFAYNGAPYPNWPPDNYVTMDSRDRDDFYDQHPVYTKAITFKDDRPVVIDQPL